MSLYYELNSIFRTQSCSLQVFSLDTLNNVNTKFQNIGFLIIVGQAEFV